MTIRHALGTTLLLTLTACGPFGADTTDVSNQGVACIWDGRVTVTFTECMGDCAALANASCEASVDGDTLTVTSAGTLETRTLGACITVCESARTSCTPTGNLDGVTRIVYAGQETQNTVCPERLRPDGPEYETNDISNQGTACIQDGTVRVDFDQCLSSSCDQARGLSCEGTVEGNTLTVTSVGEVVSQVDGNCTNDCNGAVVTCNVTGDLRAVTTIAYAGEDSTDLGCPLP